MKSLVIVSLLLINSTFGEFNEENFVAQLNLIDMDLEDKCEDISKSMQDYILKGANFIQEENFLDKELEDYGRYLRRRSEHLMSYFQSEDDFPMEYARNLTLLIKNGDTLLSEEQYKKLVRYFIAIQDIRYEKEMCVEPEVCNTGLQDIENTLATSRNITVLEESWIEHGNFYQSVEEDFPNILNLANNASTANHQYNVKKYWEMLVEVEDGYQTALNLWTEIEPLYKKLQEFVRVRLNNFYETNFTNIPAYLLGSPLGNDWTNIADIILPHPQLLYDINLELEGLKDGKSFYKLAENATKGMGLGKLGQKFWVKSKFSQTHCNNEVLTFCSSSYSEVITCKRSSFIDYLNAHEAAFEVVVNNKDYTSLGRQRLRYSPLNDAIKDLGSVMALVNAPYNGLLSPETFKTDVNQNKNNKFTALLLVALRLLPKLPYYLAADLWRIEELERPSNNLTESWWSFRQKYQGLDIPENDFIPDYLADPYITSNKPYLSKFFGTIIAFQLLNYYQVSMFEDDVRVYHNFKEDESFKAMLADKVNRDVLNLLSINYGLSSFESYDILHIFEPLETYFNDSPIEQTKIVQHSPRNTLITTPKPKVKFNRTKQNDVVPVTTDPSVNQVIQITKMPVDQAKPKTKESVPMTEQKRNSYIFIGVASILIVCTALYAVFIKCRKKVKAARTNNRRFET